MYELDAEEDNSSEEDKLSIFEAELVPSNDNSVQKSSPSKVKPKSNERLIPNAVKKVLTFALNKFTRLEH